jgi:hypothetical protein
VDLVCSHHRSGSDLLRVTDLKIGLLSMVFSIAFIPLSLPSIPGSIDQYGYRKAVSIGAILNVCSDWCAVLPAPTMARH